MAEVCQESNSFGSAERPRSSKPGPDVARVVFPAGPWSNGSHKMPAVVQRKAASPGASSGKQTAQPGPAPAPISNAPNASAWAFRGKDDSPEYSRSSRASFGKNLNLAPLVTQWSDGSSYGKSNNSNSNHQRE